MRSDPRFVAWQAGVRHDPADRDPRQRTWLALISEVTRQGVEVRRARIVSEPVSDYIAFEHYLTGANVDAGEHARWLPRRRATGPALPGDDFRLFDDERLLVNLCSGDGDWTGTEAVGDPAAVKLCASAFEAVWAAAVPHAEYRPS